MRKSSLSRFPSTFAGGLYVQYGCGFCAPKTWKNFDASPTLRFEKLPIIGKLYTKNPTRFPKNVQYGDIVRGLPLPQESCAAIYASHVLEHLALEDFRVALKNTYSLLRRGGIFRLVLPDLEAFAKAYVESNQSTAAEEFMQKTNLGLIKRPRRWFDFLKSWLGHSGHLWMWDFKSMRWELSSAGFIDIRRCEFGDCPDLMFRDVEEEGRFVDAVAIECKKP